MYVHRYSSSPTHFFAKGSPIEPHSRVCVVNTGSAAVLKGERNVVPSTGAGQKTGALGPQPPFQCHQHDDDDDHDDAEHKTTATSAERVKKHESPFFSQ